MLLNKLLSNDSQTDEIEESNLENIRLDRGWPAQKLRMQRRAVAEYERQKDNASQIR